ncbi:unnamed protein product (macronuclear) [Paramecium tetraurelia]|uniref:Uncharacterized protein n=1 Tax=Paramecium tetraurelia TaxID=5888 RepID=A0DS44_PARTE|nr:uncharacterized protein GSPATT00019565001 [Paramecium tetraurelia]CAK85861.1 unnamed protein product [Paramecium tetraurelia]|eukprot:XP_001453258.1 hypothetical protein (macronuclear) [Paramecium tetraurelia strain d4-2]
MGNGQCCKRVERVETFQYEDETSHPEASKLGSLKQGDQQPQMLSQSDSDEEYPKRKQQQLSVLKEPQKTSQLSTIQQYSFQSLSSEQQFQNFVTFQALPSQHGMQGNVFSKFQAEMNQIAQQQQPQVSKNSKKVQFAN